MKILKTLTASLAVLASGSALADEAAIKAGVESALGGRSKVESVRKSGILGLYEVQVGGEILYTDEKAQYIFAGEILDAKTRINLTQQRINQMSAINFAELPLDLAIKQVRGNGKRTLATFEDPNCSYCKKLAKELLTLNDVTVYTFLTPVLGPDSHDKAKSIWCAPNRGKAWTEWMTAAVAPPSAAANCDTSGLQKSIALGEKYRVRGTPTMFLVSGERVSGYVPVAQLEPRMNAAAAAPASAAPTPPAPAK